MKRAGAVFLLVAGLAGLLWAGEPGSPEPGTGRMVVQALAGLGAVVGLVVLTRYVLVRLGAGMGGGSVRLREVVRLSPHHALYVVEVDGRRLLLGHQVSLVCELGPAASEATVGFADRLRDAARGLRGREGTSCGRGS